MRYQTFPSTLFAIALSLSAAPGCDKTPDGPVDPGADATDQRVPELGGDLKVLDQSKIRMADAFAQIQKAQGPIIEAKFELDDSKKLSLSTYPVGMPLTVDAERNKFQEYAGDPTVSPFTGKLDVFMDQEHLTRSSRDLTLIQLSRLSLADAVAQAASEGLVYWAIPTIRAGRAGYGIYTSNNSRPLYRFIDGGGSMQSSPAIPVELGMDPGTGATDQRVPELGTDLSVLSMSKITMAQGIAQVEQQYGVAIEGKFELDSSMKLSLSIYPVGNGITTDAQRNKFSEVAGDPVATPWTPTISEFMVPDVEHLTRSARNLTLVQTAGISLKDAVNKAQAALPGGFVYWAIPTIRDTRAGYGVYVYGADKKSHYFFISG